MVYVMSTAQPTVPYHLGIIMDGNGRWALQQGSPRWTGHRAGVHNVEPILDCCLEAGISYLTLYSFSTENWDRSVTEISGLMMLASYFIRYHVASLKRNGIQLRHSGRLDKLPARLQREIQQAIDDTRQNERLILNVAFNYGGRDEIVQATRQMMQAGMAPDDVTEDSLRAYLHQADLPDLDLIIRTGGEFRLSNFMLWQAAYAEYYATETYWPAFGRAHLHKALNEFNQRERRFGRVRGV